MRRVFIIALSCLLLACVGQHDPNKDIPDFLTRFPKNSFVYPIGEKEFMTEANDWWDSWYNAQDFGENRHVGEDWNKITGGDTDCGEPVYATAAGEIKSAGDAGPGWGNIIIIEHTAPDGTKLRSLYGHLGSILRSEGEVQRRELIGTIGSANGRYPCHLHFEIRWIENPVWDAAGPGYSDDLHGWIDPSEFIERQRNPPVN